MAEPTVKLHCMPMKKEKRMRGLGVRNVLSGLGETWTYAEYCPSVL
jgi:hypothetical protein